MKWSTWMYMNGLVIAPLSAARDPQDMTNAVLSDMVHRLSKAPIIIVRKGQQRVIQGILPHIVHGYIKEMPKNGFPVSIALTGTKLDFLRPGIATDIYGKGKGCIFLSDNSWYSLEELS